MHRHLPILLTAVLLLAVPAACGDDDDNGMGPEPIDASDVVGSYEAEVFRSMTGGVTTDHLAEGAEITLVLSAAGSTSGRLFVPGGAEGGGDLDVSLDGTWTFDDAADEVEFDHTADTFIRDMTFSASRSGGGVQLRGVDTFGDTSLEVVLGNEGVIIPLSR